MAYTSAAQKGTPVASALNGREETQFNDFTLSRINLLFAVRNEDVRRALKGGLRRRGFNAIHDFGTATSIREALCAEFPDLLICDQDLPDGDICDMVRHLRHQDLGHNPFTLVIVLLTDPSAARIRRAIDSGTDDIIAAPTSIDTLSQRFLKLVERRKPFVVTNDYVGPTRRKKARPGAEEVPLIRVPNSAKLKLEGECSQATIQKLVEKASGMVTERKLEREAVQVSYRVDRVMEQHRKGRSAIEMRPHLERLAELARDIERRVKGARRAEVADMCRTLLQVAVSLLGDLDRPDLKSVELLPPVAAALEAAFAVKPEVCEAPATIQ